MTGITLLGEERADVSCETGPCTQGVKTAKSQAQCHYYTRYPHHPVSLRDFGSARKDSALILVHRRVGRCVSLWRKVTIGRKGTWEIKIKSHRVGWTNDFRYLELGLVGPSDFELTLEVVKTETTDGVLGVIRAFLDKPGPPHQKCILRLKPVAGKKGGRIVNLR